MEQAIKDLIFLFVTSVSVILGTVATIIAIALVLSYLFNEFVYRRIK